MADLTSIAWLRPDHRYHLFSSYDRKGGNFDGFEGSWSQLRFEDGDSVIAEMGGAGRIDRIWFTHSAIDYDGLLGGNQEHIRIYLDGSDVPVLDVPLEAIFDASLPQFPVPLAGSALGGFFSYTPIPFRNGCKVVIEGDHVRYYQLGWTSYPDSQAVDSFTLEDTAQLIEDRARAVALWSAPGDVKNLDLKDPDVIEIPLTLQEGESVTVDLAEGPRAVRAALLFGGEEALLGTVRMTWDGAASPAVDLPLRLLFGQVLDPEEYQTLFVGGGGPHLYNFLPMPYRESARIEITATAAMSGTLRLVTEPWSHAPELSGYLHAHQESAFPIASGEYFPLLVKDTPGHLAGVILGTSGPAGPPRWLEGDEIFFVDGELVANGTGTEDYWNVGWYGVPGRMDQSGWQAVHGIPVFDYGETRTRISGLRWHFSDPVPFDRIDAHLEHGPLNDVPADYQAAVFAYSAEP